MEYAIGTNSCRPFSDWLSVNSVSVFSPTASSSLITPDESREELNHHRINPAGGLDLWKKLIARIPAAPPLPSAPLFWYDDLTCLDNKLQIWYSTEWKGAFAESFQSKCYGPLPVGSQGHTDSRVHCRLAACRLIDWVKSSNFISWLLYNRNAFGTQTCETVNKSSKSIIMLYRLSSTRYPIRQCESVLLLTWSVRRWERWDCRSSMDVERRLCATACVFCFYTRLHLIF